MPFYPRLSVILDTLMVFMPFDDKIKWWCLCHLMKKIIFIFLLYFSHACHSTHIEGRGQLLGVFCSSIM